MPATTQTDSGSTVGSPGPGRHAGRQPQDVSADRIRHLYRCVRVRKIAHIARVTKMIEENFVKHFAKFAREILIAVDLQSSG